MVELVEHREWIVEVLLPRSENLLPVSRVDREDPLRAPLHHSNPELWEVDVVMLGEQLEGLLGLGIENRGHDERLEPVVRLPLFFFSRIPARYVFSGFGHVEGESRSRELARPLLLP